MLTCLATSDGFCIYRGSGAEVKYFDDPVYDSKYTQFIDLFAELIEKYGGDLVIPEEAKQGWEKVSSTVQKESTKSILTKPDAA